MLEEDEGSGVGLWWEELLSDELELLSELELSELWDELLSEELELLSELELWELVEELLSEELELLSDELEL